jgi:hypothetical protein
MTLPLIYIGCTDEINKVATPDVAATTTNVSALMKSSNASYQQINDAIEDVAIIIAKSLEDKEFREFLKAEALKKFDGDYDILYSLVKEKISGNGKTLSARVNAITTEFKKSTGKFKTEFSSVEELINKIPKLQIAIPVNCESWNTDNYVPPVACLNSELKNKLVTQVKAYDSKGNVTMLDKSKAPDYPVVVISINERLDENGDVRTCYTKKSNTTQKTVYNPKVSYKISGWGTPIKILTDSVPGGEGGGGTGGGGTTIHERLVVEDLMCMNNNWHENWTEGEPEFYLEITKEVFYIPSWTHMAYTYWGRQYINCNGGSTSPDLNTEIECMRDQYTEGPWTNIKIELREEDGGSLGSDDWVEESWALDGTEAYSSYWYWNTANTWMKGSHQHCIIQIWWEFF